MGITWHEDEEGARGTAREVEQVGGSAVVARLDLTDLPDAGDVIDELADQLGGIDALVQCSGTGTSTLLTDLSWEDSAAGRWRRDLDGAFVCLQRAARRMVRDGGGGRIVNITSVHEHQPRVGASAYCAAKGGLGLLTRTAALELAEHGITVNAVAPGEIATPMTGQTDEDVPLPPTASTSGRAYRCGARAMPARSRPSSSSSARRRRATSPAPPGPSTAGCSRWARWRARTSTATTGGDRERRCDAVEPTRQ